MTSIDLEEIPEEEESAFLEGCSESFSTEKPQQSARQQFDQYMEGVENEAEKRTREHEEQAEECNKRYLAEKKGIRTITDEFGSYDHPLSGPNSFNSTTLRLITEFITKTGKSSTIVNLPSFKAMIAHLNPMAGVPTEDQVEFSRTAVKPIPSPTACIVCGNNGEERSTITLNENDASIVLAATIIDSNRDANDAARRILSASLRSCAWHLNHMCQIIVKNLKLDKNRDFSKVSVEKLAEWSYVYQTIKQRKDKCVDEGFGVEELKEILGEFLDEYFSDPDGGEKSPAPLENRREIQKVTEKEVEKEIVIKEEVIDEDYEEEPAAKKRAVITNEPK